MDIREELGSGTVTVKGHTIAGFLEPNRACQYCRSSPVVYVDNFDAYACPYCSCWLEDKCDDPQCSYCPGRPENPFSD